WRYSTVATCARIVCGEGTLVNQRLSSEFATLSTPLIADACLKLAVSFQMAPAVLRSIPANAKIAGRVLPAGHSGSVDVFLEAFEAAEAGDVLVVDNQGRLDEGCIGDLTVLEARAAGLAGAIVWGLIRDTPELDEIAFPVFSYGRVPSGPRRLDPALPDRLVLAKFGEGVVTKDDVVFADPDGAIFVAAAA